MSYTVKALETIPGFPDIAFYAIVAVVGLLAVVFGTIAAIKLSKPRKKAIKEEIIALSQDDNEIYKALGGKDNVTSHRLVGSRLSISIKDSGKVDGESLKAMGLSKYILGSEKITIVLEGKSRELAAKLFPEDVEG